MFEKKMILQFLGLFTYVCLSVTGLTLIKIGLTHKVSLTLDAHEVGIHVNWILLLGMLVYVISFIASMLVMKNMKLSLYYPLSAGLAYILVCLVSCFVLKEIITFKQMVGMVIIFIGVIVMNLGN